MVEIDVRKELKFVVAGAEWTWESTQNVGNSLATVGGVCETEAQARACGEAASSRVEVAVAALVCEFPDRVAAAGRILRGDVPPGMIAEGTGGS